MQKNFNNNWNSKFHLKSGIFKNIHDFFSEKFINFTRWPSVDELNHMNFDSKIKFIPQIEKSSKFSEQYEPRIYLKKEVQTREQNWHDFFNALIWMMFPKTKTTINELQYKNLLHRKNNFIKQRTKQENFLTHFDECGILVISCENKYLDLIKEHKWKELFLQNRDAIDKKIKFIVFGHALYEMSIFPFIGLTGKGLLLHVEEKDIQLNGNQLIKRLDGVLQGYINNTNLKLNPVPILGIPGWYEENKNESFYDITSYFRIKAK